MGKINMSRDQKKIVILSCVVSFAFLALWIFLYLPASQEIKRLKNELVSIDTQIQDIEGFLSGARNRDEAIRLLKKREQYFSSKFPQKEEEGLRVIAELARKYNINIVSLQPGVKTEFLAASGKPLSIEGRVSNYLPLTLEISCFYKDLVKYLWDLKSALPLFVNVDSLNIKKEVPLTGKVRANVNFNLYLLID